MEKFIILDVETANEVPDTLVYDLGYIVADKNGKIYEQKSMVVSDIYTEEKDLMEKAYYAHKIPLYEKRLKDKSARYVSIFTARKYLHNSIKKYGVKNIYAYNANFDRNALNTTQRYLSKSKYRYFLPYGINFNCIWHMACQTICNRMDYCLFCLKNGYYTEKGNMTTNAETVYKFLTKNQSFEEEHTGLSDVKIELEILQKCLTYHEKTKEYIYRGCFKIPQAKFKRTKNLYEIKHAEMAV